MKTFRELAFLSALATACAASTGGSALAQAPPHSDAGAESGKPSDTQDRAETPGAPASGAANVPGGSETLASHPPEEPAVPACGAAAPACFRACGPAKVRSLRGLCVPARPPADLPRVATAELSVKMSTAPDAAPPTSPNGSSARDGEQPCCLVPIEITAEGITNLGDRADKRSLATEVRINGQIMGNTAFADALPLGDYWIRLELAGHATQGQLIKLRSGHSARIHAKYHLAPSAVQQRQLDAWRARRLQEHRNAERAADALRRAAKAEAYTKKVSDWEQRTHADRDARSLHLIWGLGLMGGGVALGTTGFILEASAASTHDEVAETAARWELEVDPLQRAALARRVDELQGDRDVLRGFGVASWIAGGASLIGGIVVLSLAPGVDERPARPDDLKLVPTVTANSAQIQLGGRF